MPTSLRRVLSGHTLAGLLFATILPPSDAIAGKSLELLFPSGQGLSRTTVGASADLRLGPGVRVEALDGSPGIVTNAGNGAVDVGPGVSAGSLVSTGPILLGPNVTASRAASSTTVSLAPGDQVGTVEQGLALTPLVSRPVVVPSLSGPGNGVSVSPGGSATLPPGRYSVVSAGPRSVVTVSAGLYVIDSLDLGAQSQIALDTSGGAVTMFVNSSVRWQGSVVGDATRFLFALVGDGTMVLEGGFRGTALAPGGTLELKPSTARYEGTFYGRHVIVAPQVTIRKLRSPMLLDGITVSNATPCVGEPVEVKVTAGSDSAATTWIQGVVGTRQYVQFRDAPGPRTVFVTASAPDGSADFLSIPVTLGRCTLPPGGALPVAMHFWGGLKKPNVVEFIVRDLDANGHEVFPAGPATYAWTFGDGQTATTSGPYATHDYTAAIDPRIPFSYFDVSVTVTRGTATSSARKVVPIWSLYAKNRAKGVIQPPSTASLSASGIALAIRNLEPAPISIESALVELLPCDPNLEPRRQPAQPLAVTVAPGATAAVDIPLPPVTGDVCAVGAHLTGHGAVGRVYADGYATLKANPLLTQTVTDAATLALLEQASALTSDANRFDEFELRALFARGALTSLPPAIGTATTPSARALKQGGGAPQVGAPCEPGDTSPLGLICAPTKGWVVVGPEFLNAFKGNFIMDHGCGKIGQLLSAVEQLFSHTSTMVKNRVAVRHSTASSDRMNSNVDYVRERLDPHTLQHGYPGTAGAQQTYTIDQMVSEYFVVDPYDAGKTWRMGGELNPNPAQCANDTTVVMPVVVRPAPDAPAEVFQAVASVADHTDVNSHYRFFNYSRADLLLPGAGWATGTVSTVCSSFDWLAAQRAGLPLRNPALRQPGVPDGMRLYSVNDRVKAGNALYEQVAKDVGDACSPSLLGVVFGGAGYLLGGPVGAVIGGVTGAEYCSRMIDNVANQVNNCFANDGCDDTSDRWRNPGTGIAVSPDDLLDWDTSHDGGTYGYNEPLVYQPKGYRRAYAWAAAPGSGSMTVNVVNKDNAPYPNATVLLNTTPVGTTNANGVLEIQTLAAGSYEVGAQFNPCATADDPVNCTKPLEQANRLVSLPENGSITVTLTLCAGPVVGGVVTSCAQPGAGPRLTKVGIAFGPEHYNLCVLGAGFEPGGPPVDITLLAPGGFFKGPYSTGVDAGGGIWNVIGIEQYFSSSFSCSGQVTVRAYDKLQDVVVEQQVPAGYWCTNRQSLPDYGGGCQP